MPIKNKALKGIISIFVPLFVLFMLSYLLITIALPYTETHETTEEQELLKSHLINLILDFDEQLDYDFMLYKTFTIQTDSSKINVNEANRLLDTYLY